MLPHQYITYNLRLCYAKDDIYKDYFCMHAIVGISNLSTKMHTFKSYVHSVLITPTFHLTPSFYKHHNKSQKLKETL